MSSLIFLFTFCGFSRRIFSFRCIVSFRYLFNYRWVFKVDLVSMYLNLIIFLIPVLY